MKVIPLNDKNTVKEFDIDGRIFIVDWLGKKYLIYNHTSVVDNNREPSFKHDCDRCIFIGKSYDERDLYVCPEDNFNIIARKSSMPEDYISGKFWVKELDFMEDAERIKNRLEIEDWLNVENEYGENK